MPVKREGDFVLEWWQERVDLKKPLRSLPCDPAVPEYVANQDINPTESLTVIMLSYTAQDGMQKIELWYMARDDLQKCCHQISGVEPHNLRDHMQLAWIAAEDIRQRGEDPYLWLCDTKTGHLVKDHSHRLGWCVGWAIDESGEVKVNSCVNLVASHPGHGRGLADAHVETVKEISKRKIVCRKAESSKTRAKLCLCKQNCGRAIAPGLYKGKPFSTCCRLCALGKGHSPECIATLPPQEDVAGSLIDFESRIHKADIEKKALSITVQSATGLRNADRGLFLKSDPFCTVEILNRSGYATEVAKTKVKHNTCNPQWHEKLYLKDYGVGQTIVFKVWDKDYWTPDDFLGRAEVTSEMLSKRFGSSVLALKLDEGRKGASTLYVEIVVQDDGGIAVSPSEAVEKGKR